jgi:hypothetical protein
MESRHVETHRVKAGVAEVKVEVSAPAPEKKRR